LTRPEKVKDPELLAVVVAVETPLKVTVAPFPPAPEIVPEILNVWAVAVKEGTVTFAPLRVTDWLEGAKVKPDLLGVTV
jgi:hypothetical protein